MTSIAVKTDIFMPRTRTDSIGSSSGGSRSVFINGNHLTTINGQSGVLSDWKCVDTVHSGPPFTDESDLFNRLRTTKPLRVNGSYEDGSYRYDYNGMVLDFPTALVAKEVIFVDWDALKTSALQKFNFNVPDVDVPLFLFELREFPRLLKRLGDIKRGASRPSLPGDYLGYQFGWAPLISDLTTLVQLASRINERINRLKRFAKGETIRVGLGQHDRTRKYKKQILFLPTSAKGEFLSKEQTQYWATLKMTTSTSFPILIDRSSEIRRALGLNLAPSTLWNAIPWTWLIDYFAEVSQFLDANRGQVSFNGTTLCLMAHSKYIDEFVEANPSFGLDFLGGNLTSEFKMREVYHNPSPRLIVRNVLSAREITNIGALLTAGRLRSHAKYG